MPPDVEAFLLCACVMSDRTAYWHKYCIISYLQRICTPSTCTRVFPSACVNLLYSSLHGKGRDGNCNPCAINHESATATAVDEPWNSWGFPGCSRADHYPHGVPHMIVTPGSLLSRTLDSPAWNNLGKAVAPAAFLLPVLGSLPTGLLTIRVRLASLRQASSMSLSLLLYLAGPWVTQ